jgi:hypothetical protein
MQRLTLHPDGPLLGPDGQPFQGQQVDARLIDVAHLAAHVVSYALPQGDVVKVLVQYSCHCWTSAHDPVQHAGQVQIMDGTRARVQDPVRLQASVALSQLIASLDRHRIYVTASDRNYGVYNAAFVTEDGTAYTAFFVLRPQKGRFDGIRHSLGLFVESAYHAQQPQVGSKTSLTAVLAAALKGDKVKYRR